MVAINITNCTCMNSWLQEDRKMGAIIAKTPKTLSFDRESGKIYKPSGYVELDPLDCKYLQAVSKERLNIEKLEAIVRPAIPMLDLLLEAKTADAQEKCLRSIAEEGSVH
mmetsp:Transcript_38296/g.80234  ORF Transcript_38296/g.80234 Transcript_38296/m.80234 type:complete len:110 (-) Transcript_38296:386-715(-)